MTRWLAFGALRRSKLDNASVVARGADVEPPQRAKPTPRAVPSPRITRVRSLCVSFIQDTCACDSGNCRLHIDKGGQTPGESANRNLLRSSAPDPERPALRWGGNHGHGNRWYA